MSRLQPEHAVDALIRLTTDNPGEITLVALAPLTNIALACRLDPLFVKKLKNVVIMGGNFEAKGNDTRVCAEFNFHSDVESAFVCLNELKSPVSIVTWRYRVCTMHVVVLTRVSSNHNEPRFKRASYPPWTSVSKKSAPI